MLLSDTIQITPTGVFSLAETCGPVTWARGRLPNVDWIDGVLVWIGWESDRVVVREVTQAPSGAILVTGEAAGAESWARAVLGIDRAAPVAADPVVRAISVRFPGLRPNSAGSLFEGVVSCIAGQSITVAAAAVTQARIAALCHPGVEVRGRRFWPMPRPEDLVDVVPDRLRATGLTWRRVGAIIGAARAWLDGLMPAEGEAVRDPDAARAALRGLPLVGPWTAESALLWGIGLDDAYPPNDAALLRAARLAYDTPGLTHRQLNALAETWAPHRAWACRWLWTNLMGHG